jgi:hypothetical protein
MTFIRQNNPLECNGIKMKIARPKRVQSSEKDERTDLSKKYKNGGNFRGIWLIFHKNDGKLRISLRFGGALCIMQAIFSPISLFTDGYECAIL